jgi:hypothetical protein
MRSSFAHPAKGRSAFRRRCILSGGTFATNDLPAIPPPDGRQFSQLTVCTRPGIIKKSDYVNTLVPRIKTLKIETFGHDCVVLHEADIRRKRGAFSMLSKEPREAFLETLTTIIEDLPMTVVAVVIDKRKLNEKYSTPYNPYILEPSTASNEYGSFSK